MAEEFGHWRWNIHNWIAVGVYQRDQPTLDVMDHVMDDRPIRPMTDVLYRCDICRRIKTVSVQGKWTIEQVRGQSSPSPEVKK